MLRRRAFLIAVPAAGLATLRLPAQTAEEEEPRPLDDDLVNRFVGSSHGNLDAVKEMVAEEPRLVAAAWDWGNGDWETGLGAASHVGRPDIATFLLERGARLDAFAAAMLGHRRTLTAMLDDFPTIHSVPGPHGITLLCHGVVAGDNAVEMTELLLDRGADVNGSSNRGMTSLMMAAGLGRVDLVELLLAAGADPEQEDASGGTAMTWAERRERDEVIKLLQDL